MKSPLLKNKKDRKRKIIIGIIIYAISMVFFIIIQSNFIFLPSITAKGFKEILTEHGYTVKEITKSENNENIIAAYCVQKENLEIKFYEFVDLWQAGKLYSNHVFDYSSVKNDMQYSKTEVNNGTHTKFVLEGSTIYYLEKINNTVVLAKCSLIKKAELYEILDEMGYNK